MEYLMLDFGDVLFYPTTGDWFMTPLFNELININDIDWERFKKVKKECSIVLSYPAYTLEDEYYIFKEFYYELLFKSGYIADLNDIKELAYNYVYESDKCRIFYDVKEELERLSKKYKLLMLSDNWPSGIRLLKENGIYDYFLEVYISSIYGSLKQEGDFFYYPIHKYKLNKENCLFIDDNDSILTVAENKNLNVMLMNRYNKDIKTKHKVINNLKNIE